MKKQVSDSPPIPCSDDVARHARILRDFLEETEDVPVPVIQTNMKLRRTVHIPLPLGIIRKDQKKA